MEFGSSAVVRAVTAEIIWREICGIHGGVFWGCLGGPLVSGLRPQHSVADVNSKQQG